MSRASTLARVIGLTRSLSPFERNQAEDTNPVIAGGVTEAPANDTALPESAVTGNVPLLPEISGALPTLAQVTVVAGELPATTDPDPVREAVTSEAIDAIEADIATLLASLDTVGDLPRSAVSDDEDEGPAPADDEDVEETTLALLSELDRMWRIDPKVGASFR